MQGEGLGWCGDAEGSLAHLEAVEQMVQLLRGEVPGQLGQEVVDVLHYGLVFTSLVTRAACTRV